MTRYSRAQWGARAARSGPGPLDRRQVRGVALHWPAMAHPIRHKLDVFQALRDWQSYHMDGKGWSDIAYQEAIDQSGNSYVLRGLHTQPGANGDEDVNEEYGAILLILAPDEKPTADMMRTLRRRLARFKVLYPHGRKVVGHGDIRPEPTACPGPIVQQMIDYGVFRP